MEIEFDPAKDASNVQKHRMSLAAGADMDLDKALVLKDLAIRLRGSAVHRHRASRRSAMRDVLHDARGGVTGHQHSPGECPGKEAL